MESGVLPSKHDGLIFGDRGQLRVLGYSGEDGHGHKLLVCECSICKEDPELFGKGLFKITYNNIRLNNTPCGCASKRNWTREQQSVRVKRMCDEKGYSFLGFVEPFIGDRTKLKLLCEDHGVWETTSIGKLMQNRGCQKCALARNGLKKRIPDEDVIKSFILTGSFPEGTLFSRSNRKTNQGVSNYWNVYCPICDTRNEAWVGNLQKGCIPCKCGKYNPKQGYINLVKDGDIVLAIKFGVSRDSLTRLYSINHNSVYEIENFCVYDFDETISARKAEIECKYLFTCGVISKTEMNDGYSETTSIGNLESVMKIYEKHGGVRIK